MISTEYSERREGHNVSRADGLFVHARLPHQLLHAEEVNEPADPEYSDRERVDEAQLYVIKVIVVRPKQAKRGGGQHVGREQRLVRAVVVAVLDELPHTEEVHHPSDGEHAQRARVQHAQSSVAQVEVVPA